MCFIKACGLAAVGLLLATIGTTIAAEERTASPALPAFYIAEFEVTDAAAMKPYSAQVESTFKPFGGHFIVRGGGITELEGNPERRKMVIIAFDSAANAQAWYDSPAYAPLKQIRHQAAKSDVYIVEGLPQLSGGQSR